MSLAGWLNTAWMLRSAREGRAFRRATRRVAAAQAEVLATILHANRDTTFGRAHHFCRLRGPEHYQQAVPLSCYEDYGEAIHRIGIGQSRVLTRDRVELLEPTSGTTGGEKLIPFTAALRRQFERAVSAWIEDLFRHRPALRQGRAYWSISPAHGPMRRSTAGIPIGFDDDTAYLGFLERGALKHLLVVPSLVARLPDIETFRYCTLLAMLQAVDLTLISIWSPTFLTALLAPLEEWHDRFCFDLRHGTLSPPARLPRALVGSLTRRRRAPRRAGALEVIFRSRVEPAGRLRRVWPRLGLISCWADASAAGYVPQLRQLFPTVEIQPKGLLATEGCVTFPLLGRAAAVLAVRSGFFEFQELDGARCRFAHDLERGGRYRVVLTTGGGLYRYQLGDQVEVAGFEHTCPLLRFQGKSDRISDLVGEKLAEPHVRAVLDRLFSSHGLSPRFALLVPTAESPPRYRLYVQGPQLDAAAALIAELEAGLTENPHYRYAVGLRQIAPVEIEILDPDGESAWNIYERRCLTRGQRMGNIKPAAIDTWTGWPADFDCLRHPSKEARRS